MLNARRTHSPARHTRQARFVLRAAWPILQLAAWCLLLAGCRSLGSQGPVSESVAMCRQLTQQGTNAMQRGDWLRAETLLERAVAASPDDVDARRNYAETLLHRGDPQAALVQLEEACQLCGADPSLTVRSGEVYLTLGRLGEAGRRVDDALQMDPRFAPAWALRGRISSAAGEYRAALADYQRSLSYAPDSYDVNVFVAEAYRQLNEPERALVTLQALADRYPPGEEPSQVLRLQGMALVALTRYEDAVRSYASAAEREPPTADLLCDLAQAQFLSGDAVHARTTLDKALALNPNHAAGRALMTQIATASRTIVR